ncbi:MAG: NAD-dependent epimerase/dehydratase family protein [Anaerolineae bacterium]
MSLAGRVVCVTGATGFVGTRLVERLLLDQGAAVRALVHNYTSAAWLSRTTAQLIQGDVTQQHRLKAAFEGCDLVVHCAAQMGGTPSRMREVNVIGTQNVLQAADDAKVRRVIHISSFAVHGRHLPDGADETAPLHPGDDVYALTKLQAEEAVGLYRRDHYLDAVILRPTIIYGPRSQWWTIDPIERIKHNRLALLGRGDGIANVVYIDDVIDAIMLALEAPRVGGETFLVSASEKITWRDFYGAYASMLGTTLSEWPVPLAYLVSRVTQQLDGRIVHLQAAGSPGMWALAPIVGLKLVRKLAGSMYKLQAWEIPTYRNHGQASVAKAQRMLGFCPRWTLEQAMAETAIWLKAQGHLPG